MIIICYPKLPDIIPTHYNLIGHVDGFGEKDNMAADVITQASVHRKNVSDYPKNRELDDATIAIAKTLTVILASAYE